MKIGIYGGSFNPIHKGHISIAKLAVEILYLDKLIIIPVGTPSHQNKILVDGEKRFEMCKLAFKNDEKIVVSDIEIKLESKSYTYDTLLKIIELYPNCEYFEIIGEDSAGYFEKWKNYNEILELSKVIVFKRDGNKIKLKNKNMIELENELFNFSSTEVRKCIQENKSVEKMIPKEIAEYIEKNKLYKSK